MKKCVNYYRVSTRQQGDSGLGLEAQRRDCLAWAERGGYSVENEYTEIESGKVNDRPVLADALAYAKVNGCTLVISKLDRLGRNASFLMSLRDSKVDFVCCDMPEANTMTIGFMAILAQHERETISQRTKKALESLKARGVQLGNPSHLTPLARKKGNIAMSTKFRLKYGPYVQFVNALYGQGVKQADIPGRLAEAGMVGLNGRPVSVGWVNGVLKKPKVEKRSVWKKGRGPLTPNK